tara:strand:- start:55 stop:495 length:441 start_codon:yes stop_codon:yes gene_type:complete
VILNIIYWATQRKWLLISLLLATVLYLLPTPQGLTAEGYHTIIIVLSTILLIVFEPIPLPAVAMLILVFQVLFGIATPNQVASSFMSDAVFFIMGSLMLAVAIVSQDLDTDLPWELSILQGTRPGVSSPVSLLSVHCCHHLSVNIQ